MNMTRNFTTIFFSTPQLTELDIDHENKMSSREYSWNQYKKNRRYSHRYQPYEYDSKAKYEMKRTAIVHNLKLRNNLHNYYEQSYNKSLDLCFSRSYTGTHKSYNLYNLKFKDIRNRNNDYYRSDVDDNKDLRKVSIEASETVKFYNYEEPNIKKLMTNLEYSPKSIYLNVTG